MGGLARSNGRRVRRPPNYNFVHLPVVIEPHPSMD